MGSVHNGAQEASRARSARDRIARLSTTVVLATRGTATRHDPALAAAASPAGTTPGTRRGGRLGQRWIAVAALAVLAAGSVAIPAPSTSAATANDVLFSRAELLALPTSGSAWTALKAVADAPLPAPDLCNQDSNHHLRTLAAAAVYARTGVASYGAKARAAIMSALPTQRPGCGNAVLALGRQLTAYVAAAGLADLSATDDATFRSWLTAIRAKNIGGHPVWNSLIATHRLSPNNWGAYAGASRIAADVYLGDTADLAAAARITRGFLGDRASYASFTTNLTSAALTWSCTGSVTTYTPVNGACAKGAINVDGGVAADVSRGGSLQWPPADPGIPYQLEAIQGLGLQVEMLARHGYSDAWSWSSSALKRMAALVTRSGAAGGAGWNGTLTARQMPWLLNRRYGTNIPTTASGMGRAIGFTDWFFGSGSSSTPPPATTTTGGGGTVTVTATGAAPTISGPSVRFASTTVLTTSSPALVQWALATSAAGLRRFDVQVSVDGGAWAGLSLASATATSRWVSLQSGHLYHFRARAVDRAGVIGVWRTVGPRRGAIVGDANTAIRYAGSWAGAAYVSYLGGQVHYTRGAGPTASLRFTGTAVTVIGPKGPGRGRADVFIDGVHVGTIDALASSFAARRMLFVRNVTAGTHTITIRALGTAGRPVFAIDAIEVLATG